MNIKKLSLCILAISLASSAICGEYWPEGQDLVWEFQYPGGEGSTRSIFSFAYGYELSVDRETSGEALALRLDEAGNVEIYEEVVWNHQWIDPNYQFFSPPLQLLNFPLVVGDSWFSVSGSRVLVCTVLREEVVQVPAGEFDCIVVEVVSATAPFLFAGEYYLNREIGPVIVPYLGELVSFTFTVPTTESSWGSLKALYR